MLLAAGAAHAAEAPSASQTTDQVILTNGFFRLTFDAGSGSIRVVENQKSGVNLVSFPQGAYRALWGFKLDAPAGGGAWADNNSAGRPAVTLSNNANEASVTFIWNGLSFDSGLRIANAAITVRVIAAAGDPTSRWSLSASGLAGITPRELFFPLIGGIGRLGAAGADDRLVVPEHQGRLISDPVGRRVNFGRIYPSAFMTMQFEGFYDALGGFALGTRDTEGYSKSIQWYSPPELPSGAIWQIVHHLTQTPLQEFTLPYDATLSVFAGDWSDAATQYRNWVWRQHWVADARRKLPPAWYRTATVARTFEINYRSGTPAPYMDYDTFVTQQGLGVPILGAPSLSSLWGWEKLGSWFYGDVFPPANGWAAFDSAVKAIHAQGNFLQLLMSGIYLDAATPLWQTSAAKAAAMQDRSGSPLSTAVVVGPITHRWISMNPATTFWRSIVTDAVSTLATHNVDSIQYDNWPFAENQDDYSPGHPPGRGGNWQWLAWRSMLTAAIEAGRNVRPTLTFATEGIHELAIPLMTFYNDRDLMAEGMSYSTEGTVVPLFTYVYRPLIDGQTEYWNGVPSSQPDSFHRLALARALTWAQRAQLPSNPFINDPSYSQAVLNYYIAIGKARAKYSAFLDSGTMLPPAAVASNLVPVVLTSDGALTSYSGQASAIQTSSWRAPSGEVGIVLTNIASTSQTGKVSVDFPRFGLVGGRPHAISLHTDTGVQSMRTLQASDTIDVTLAPLQIAVLTIQAPPSDAPSQLRASVAGNEVTFTWAAPAAGTPQSYVIEGGLTRGSTLASISTTSSATSAKVIVPTGIFFVRVRAMSASGVSAPSDDVVVYVHVPAPADAPSNLLGLVDGSRLLLAWQPAPAGGQVAEWRLNVSGSVTATFTFPAGIESFSYPGVPAGLYNFTIQAVNGAGTSAPSRTVSLAFPSPCMGPPATPALFSAQRTGNMIRVTWDLPATGPAPADYSLAVTGAFNGTLVTTSRTLSGTVASGEYSLSVLARNSCGNSAPTSPVVVSVP